MKQSQEEAIRLYKCAECSKPRYMDDIQSGKTICRKCGSARVKYAPPTFKYVVSYIWHRKDWGLFRKVKELATHRVQPAE
jgi:DNA-directed RNA polymerase subunit RPC12/RpoP